MDEGMSGFCIKTRGGGGGGTKCGRWNPTGEQVKVLTDLFRSGLRTPSTDQIQRISSQLSYYGKIESKNVFYWFQNHKARERQKRRRVSVEDRCLIDRSPDDNNKQFFPTLKHLAEMNHQHNVSESDHHQREIETLQLFPLNSYEESITVHRQPEKMKFMRNQEFKETTTTTTTATFSCMFTKEIENHHLPLDLRLSFM